MESIIKRSAADSAGRAEDEQTLADSGFYWRESNGVKVLICRPLEDVGFVNGFSTRLGGVSPFPANDLNLAGYDDDTPENIEENRRRFLEALGSKNKLITVWQVHGDVVHVVRNATDAKRTDTKADGITSDSEGILAGVKTADCV